MFIIPVLSIGGAERIMTYLLKRLDKTAFDCQLVVIGSPKKISYDITDVEVKYLHKKRILQSIPRLIGVIRKESPDIIFGTVLHLNIILGYIAYFFPKKIFVARQTSILKVHDNSLVRSYTLRDLLPFAFKIALKRINYVICQSGDMAKECQSLFHVSPDKIKVLHNPITDLFTLKINSGKSKKKLNFITVGRLVEIKGHERVLDALSKYEPAFTYTIIGDGPLKEQIFDKAKTLEVLGRIRYIEHTDDVPKYLAQSDYFLQGSFAEGFPNALLESCAVGTPAIAFDVPGGTKEIIDNEVNGYLVKDEKEFLFRLNQDKDFDPKIVSDSVYKKFGKKIILGQYEAFFKEIVEKNER